MGNIYKATYLDGHGTIAASGTDTAVNVLVAIATASAMAVPLTAMYASSRRL